MAFKALPLLFGFAACLSAADPGLLDLAPSDARVAAGVNLDKAKTSKLGQHILANVQNGDQDFQNFVTLTGFDPRRDLTEILVVSPAGNSSRKLLLVRGNFVDPSKLQAAALAHGATSTSYRGVSILSGPDKNNQDVFAILDNTLGVAGDAASVRQAIDRKNQPGTAAVSSDLTRQVADVSARYDAWFVSLVPASEFAGRLPDQRVNGALQGDAFKGIQQAKGGVKLDSDPVAFSAQVVSATPNDASALAGAVQFLGGLMRMGQQQPSGALNALTNSLNVTVNANVVDISFSIPEQLLETQPHRRVAPAVQRRTMR